MHIHPTLTDKSSLDNLVNIDNVMEMMIVDDSLQNLYSIIKSYSDVFILRNALQHCSSSESLIEYAKNNIYELAPSIVDSDIAATIEELDVALEQASKKVMSEIINTINIISESMLKAKNTLEKHPVNYSSRHKARLIRDMLAHSNLKWGEKAKGKQTWLFSNTSEPDRYSVEDTIKIINASFDNYKNFVKHVKSSNYDKIDDINATETLHYIAIGTANWSPKQYLQSQLKFFSDDSILNNVISGIAPPISNINKMEGTISPSDAEKAYALLKSISLITTKYYAVYWSAWTTMKYIQYSK